MEKSNLRRKKKMPQNHLIRWLSGIFLSIEFSFAVMVAAGKACVPPVFFFFPE